MKLQWFLEEQMHTGIFLNASKMGIEMEFGYFAPSCRDGDRIPISDEVALRVYEFLKTYFEIKEPLKKYTDRTLNEQIEALTNEF
jgi:hypothetical protein